MQAVRIAARDRWFTPAVPAGAAAAFGRIARGGSQISCGPLARQPPKLCPVMPECYCAFSMLSLCSQAAYTAQPTSNGTRTPTTLYAATEPATTQHRHRFQCMCEAMPCVGTSMEPAEGTLQAQERARRNVHAGTCTPACLHRSKRTGSVYKEWRAASKVVQAYLIAMQSSSSSRGLSAL